MSNSLLAVPHRTEAFAGACLPAYLQMALAYFGVNRSFDKAPIPVPVDDLSLAWYEMGNTWAQVAGHSS